MDSVDHHDQVRRDAARLGGAVSLLPEAVHSGSVGRRALLRVAIIGGLVFAIGALLPAGMAYRDREIEIDQIRERFERAAAERSLLIRFSLDLGLRDVTGLGSFFESSESVSREEFREYAQHGLNQFAGPVALEWLPHTRPGERASVVEKARADGLTTFALTQRTARGEWVPPTRPGDLFPVLYIAPREGNAELLGRDAGGWQVDEKTLLDARDRGAMAISFPEADDLKARWGQTMVGVRPVYLPQSRPATAQKRRADLMGFAGGIFPVERTLEQAINAYSPTGVAAELYDMSDPAEPRLIYRHRSRLESERVIEPEGIPGHSQPITTDFDLAERPLRLVCRPWSGFYAEARTIRPAATLGAGLALTVLLTLYVVLLLLSRQRARERTRLLRLSQKRFEGIVNSADEAIMSCDENGRLMLFSRGAERIFGRKAEEVIGRSVSMLYPQRDHPWFEKRVRSLREMTGQEQTNERLTLTGLRADGTEFPMEGSFSNLNLDGFRVRTAILQDMTEKNRLEAQLRQAQKMEAVGRLTGGVAHDFNNLLQVINGYTSLVLMDEELGSQTRGQMEEVSKAGERAVALTRQLLAFSRRQVLQQRTLDLGELVENLAKMLRRLLGDDVEFKHRRGTASLMIRADAGQIEQVLMNLVVNARDAMETGGELIVETDQVELHEEFADTHPWMKAGQYVRMTVSDSGCGMDLATQERVFEPFFTTKSNGTGLGLATVYGIVRQHGGVVHLYSEPGIGTTFRIYLPAVEVEESARETKELDAQPGGSETILVAEDAPAVRRFVVKILTAAGYRTIEAADGQEAAEIFERRAAEIDLALLDMLMPRMNGRELFEFIRARDPHKPVIFSSGYISNSVQTEFFEQNGLILVPKPYHAGQLLAALRTALDAARDEEPDGATVN